MAKTPTGSGQHKQEVVDGQQELGGWMSPPAGVEAPLLIHLHRSQK